MHRSQITDLRAPCTPLTSLHRVGLAVQVNLFQKLDEHNSGLLEVKQLARVFGGMVQDTMPKEGRVDEDVAVRARGHTPDAQAPVQPEGAVHH